MKFGQTRQRWVIHWFLEEAILNMTVFCWLIFKNGTFLHSEIIFTHWLAVYLKEKGKCLPHTQKQQHRRYFWQVHDPGMHYISYFGPVILTYLPQDSVQKLFFCILSILPYANFVLYTFSQLCTYLHPLLYIQVHLTRLHLSTSWKTRHLVFSHMTSKKRDLFPTCTQKIYIRYNFQKTHDLKTQHWTFSDASNC